MKKMLVAAVVLCSGIAAAQSTTWNWQSESPAICIGQNCGLNVSDPTLEIEPITAPESADLDAALVKLQAAQSEVAAVKYRIAKAHGDQPMNGYGGYLCPGSVWTQTHVYIAGKYAFKTKEEHHPCVSW